MKWSNASDSELISAACDRKNWTDEALLLELWIRATARDVFLNSLNDELLRHGLDTCSLSQQMELAAKKRQTKKTSGSGILTDLVSAATIEEQATEWLIPGYIPRYQITVLAGDGGSGKTTIECALAAAVSTGEPCFLSQGVPFKAEPENVLFLSGEDDFARVLERKLRIAGADMEKIFTVQISSVSFSRIKFNSEEMAHLVQTVKPSLVLLDPMQQFVPPEVQMGQRNAMRQCLGSLISLGERYGATFVIVCHTNKQSGVSGRKRISDSADIWDIARSVLIVGDTGEDRLKYLSHEKSNYGEMQRTILYSLDGERAIFRSYSDLKDADYVRADRMPRPAPARQEAKELIIQTLRENGGRMKADHVDTALKGMGVSQATLNRAKAELKKQSVIRYSKNSFSGEWETSLTKLSGE